MTETRNADQKIGEELKLAVEKKDVVLLKKILGMNLFLGFFTHSFSEHEREWALNEISNPDNKFDILASVHFNWAR